MNPFAPQATVDPRSGLRALPAFHRSATRVDACLDRINPGNNAYVTVTADAALAAARRPVTGRLAGLVVSLKDLIDTAGVRTTYGSERFADHIPDESADIVRQLEGAGAILIGKTNLDEFANGVTGHNPFFGTMRIPGRSDHTPAGSSGGAAVSVAEGSCDLAVGTDTGGSVRLPAACCGLVGYKAAWTARPSKGVLGLAPSFDSLGFLTRELSTMALTLGLDELPPPDTFTTRPVADLSLPPCPSDAFRVIANAEAWEIHGRQFERHPETFGPHMQVQMAGARQGVGEARATLNAWTVAFNQAAQGVDVLVDPLGGFQPPTVAEAIADHTAGSTVLSARYLPAFLWVNALGWPALIVPGPDGPVQFVARPGSEPQLFAAAAASVPATVWAERG